MVLSSADFFFKISFLLLLFFMPSKEFWEAYSNRTIRPSVHPLVRLSVPFCVRCKSPTFSEVGIPNLLCEYIL